MNEDAPGPSGIDDLSHFGFECEEWLALARDAEHRVPLDRLGEFELILEAGRGGQGVVYKARRAGEEKFVALKRLKGGELAGVAARRRFAREVRMLSALDHPGIVAVSGFEVVNAQPVLVMEWVEGESISRWATSLAEDGKDARVVGAFVELCQIVQHAHVRGVIHRDLKPSNVLIEASGRARLLDLGLAKLAGAEESLEGVTAFAAFVGTPGYAAPEQASGRAQGPDVRADVYSLGVMLYECLTGTLPYATGQGALAWLREVESKAVPRPRRMGRALDAKLAAIVGKALAFEPSARYQTAGELAEDLSRYLAGEPIRARAPSLWETAKSAARRHRAGAAAACVVVAALAITAVVAVTAAVHIAAERRATLKAMAQEKVARERAEKISAFAQSLLAGVPPLQRLGQPVTARELLEAGRARLDADFADDPEAVWEVRWSLAQACMAHRMYAEAAEEYERAVAAQRAREPRDNRQLVMALLGEASAQECQGRYVESASAAAEAERVAESTGQSKVLIANTMAARARTESPERATALLTEGLALVRAESGDGAMACAFLSELGNARARAYDWTGAQQRFEEAAAIYKKVDSSGVGGALALAGAAQMRLLKGDAEGALGVVGGVVESLRARGREPDTELAGALELKAQVLDAAGRSAEALECAQSAVRIFELAQGLDDGQTAAAQSTMGAVLTGLRDFEGAEELLRTAVRTLEELKSADTTDLSAARFRLAKVLIASGHNQDGAEILTRLMADELRSARPDWLLLCDAHIALGECYLAEGKVKEAQDQAKAAQQMAAQTGEGRASREARARRVLEAAVRRGA